jgi:hypothetical protein
MRSAFQPFCTVKRTYCERVPEKPHTQSKGHEQCKVKYRQDQSSDEIADELSEPFPGMPKFS